MKKIFLSIVAAVVVLPALAGGLMTNTNQSASFLRSIARGTSLDPDAVLHNPAGVVFMENGWHFGLSDQMAIQTRSTESTFAPFAMNAANPGLMTKEFKGEVFSPLIPGVHLAWKKNRWAVMFGMGVNGGGGTMEYDGGLASFERQFSVLPAGITQLGQAYGLTANQYAMDMYLKGKSMTLAFNLGAAVRLTDWLSLSAMVRFSSTSNSYEGYMKDIQTNPSAPAMGLSGQMMSAPAFFTAAAQMLGQMGMLTPEMQMALGTNAVKTADHILDVKQKGTSWSPVIALAFHHGKWDASLKYEFKMPTMLEIESAEVSANDPVINAIFPNGSEIEYETPALLALAVSRHCGPVKVTVEWHHFFDKKARNSFTKNQMIGGVKALYNNMNCTVLGDTNEYLAGAEWTISKRWLVSLGVQRTQYNLDEQYYSDMNFSTSSTSVGLGLKFGITDNIALNAGFMKTFYEDVTAVGTYQGVPFEDIYSRSSISWGLGLDFKFGTK
ncbi:MAG: porin family protein [Rikenellaceae bacterium]|nr:porin family protein [Rikenellaceae bacterium]